MGKKAVSEDIRARILAVLNKIGGEDFQMKNLNDDLNLIKFGVDDLDKSDSLPWELQIEFNVYFGDLTPIETFGELAEAVQTEINKQ